jgi:outer membrane protein OmpA-like peptidoglycan-associated protein
LKIRANFFFFLICAFPLGAQSVSKSVAIAAIERRGGLPQFLVAGEGKLFSFAHLGDSALENNTLGVRIKLPWGIRSDGFEQVVRNQLHSLKFKVEQFQFIRIVYFDYNSILIRNDASAELDKLAAVMMAYPLGQVLVTVHADSRGSSKYNLDLASRRGLSIKKYLMDAGVEEKYLQIKVSGEEELVKDCLNAADCDEQTHQLNRRAEFSFNPMAKK